jgi:hypothetical protein
MFKKIVEALNRKAKPITKLNLLRIIKVTCDQHPQHQQLVTKFGMSSIVEELSRQDDAVLVRQVCDSTVVLDPESILICRLM